MQWGTIASAQQTLLPPPNSARSLLWPTGYWLVGGEGMGNAGGGTLPPGWIKWTEEEEEWIHLSTAHPKALSTGGDSGVCPALHHSIPTTSGNCFSFGY